MKRLKLIKQSQILEVVVITLLALSVTLKAADGDVQKADLGQELILNGNMEEGNPPDNWQRNNSELSASSDSHSGKQSLKISPSANLGAGFQSFAVKPDTQYQIDFWFKCSSDPDLLYVTIYAKGHSKNSYGDFKRNSGAGWTHWTATFKTPNIPEATTAYVNFNAPAPGKDVLIDDVSIKEVR